MVAGGVEAVEAKPKVEASVVVAGSVAESWSEAGLVMAGGSEAVEAEAELEAAVVVVGLALMV